MCRVIVALRRYCGDTFPSPRRSLDRSTNDRATTDYQAVCGGGVEVTRDVATIRRQTRRSSFLEEEKKKKKINKTKEYANLF